MTSATRSVRQDGPRRRRTLKCRPPSKILDATVHRLERGEVSALEAVDALLAEEFTLRENRPSFR